MRDCLNGDIRVSGRLLLSENHHFVFRVVANNISTVLLRCELRSDYYGESRKIQYTDNRQLIFSRHNWEFGRRFKFGVTGFHCIFNKTVFLVLIEHLRIYIEYRNHSDMNKVHIVFDSTSLSLKQTFMYEAYRKYAWHLLVFLVCE